MKEYKVLNETTQEQNKYIIERGKNELKKRTLKDKMKYNKIVRYKLNALKEQIKSL